MRAVVQSRYGAPVESYALLLASGLRGPKRHARGTVILGVAPDVEDA